MTKRVVVIFSDGSKRLAHNVDDLYERWILRRAEDDTFASEQEKAIHDEPEWTHPTTYKQCREWRVIAIRRVNAAHEKLRAIPQNKRSRSLTEERRRNRLIAEHHFYQAVLSFLAAAAHDLVETENQSIRDKRDAFFLENSAEYVSNLRHGAMLRKKKLRVALKHIRYLEAILAKYNIDFSPLELEQFLIEIEGE